jgi:phage/plasmid-like protein (TIGR03299 family)
MVHKQIGDTVAHALEVQNGEVAFALRGEPAWHGLANVLFDKDAHITTAEMLEAGKLANWNVRLEDVIIPDGYRSNMANQMVVRDNPFDGGTDVLAVVGDRYKVVQNEAIFDFADGILDGGAEWESAGSIKNGKVVFGSMTVPREFILDPQGANDKTVTYLLVHTSHDGTSAIQANITPVRVVCQNTLNMALNGSKQSYKIRHTQTVDGKISEARRVLGLTFAHMDTFEAMAKEMFETAITDAQWDNLVSSLYSIDDDSASAKAKTMHAQKLDMVNYLYKEGETNKTITGTAWGALNALTERIDYYRSARKGGEGLLAAASGFDPVVNAEKARVLQAVRSLVTA